MTPIATVGRRLRACATTTLIVSELRERLDFVADNPHYTKR
jgi:hypothetical protein